MFMVSSRTKLVSLRFSRLDKERLLLALLVSLLVHLVAWGGYLVGGKYGWLQKLFPPTKHKVAALQPKPVVQNIDPAIFIDVSQASTEPPKQAKYYSDKNSRAANPDADADANQPKLTGHQRAVPKTEDAPRPNKTKPATPQNPVAAKPEESKPATALNPGALQPGKPTDTETPEKKTPERPRTVRAALAQQSSQLPGLQMQQDGGARRALSSSLDAMATPFGAYDRAIVEAISQRWYDLLDQQKFAQNRTGKVTVYFHLHPDGAITELSVTESTVGDLFAYLCRDAIEQAAPFGKWPSDMRRMVGANFREITFTFFYY
jgi:outer membrane biosynthesis protein TonB